MGLTEKSGIQDSYDRVAARYAEVFYDELSRKPFDRALLDRYAELVAGRGEVWELGCGPGQVGRYLQERGVAIHGLDLSAEMVECARRLNPGMVFTQGTMLALPVEDATLAGIVAFYSIIHLGRAEAREALREFHRALAPGGYLLLAFHGGEGEVHSDEWFGERVDVTATLFGGDEMAGYAQDAGFAVVELSERTPYEFEHQTQRVYLLARRPE